MRLFYALGILHFNGVISGYSADHEKPQPGVEIDSLVTDLIIIGKAEKFD
jgi:hypothetical protein